MSVEEKSEDVKKEETTVVKLKKETKQPAKETKTLADKKHFHVKGETY